MQVKFIGPNTFNYVTVGREYIVDESKSSKVNLCIFNDRHKECLYPREYFERVKPEKKNNRFYFWGGYDSGFNMTTGNIYVVDFHQSSATHYSVRNDHKRRILVPRYLFREHGATQAAIDEHVEAASIAEQSSVWNDAQWAEFDSRSSASYKAANVVRREYEFSLGWAKTNPELMGKALVDLIEENSFDEWQLTVDNSRKGFITYIAKRK